MGPQYLLQVYAPLLEAVIKYYIIMFIFIVIFIVILYLT